jgi:hypothetical protein
MQTPRAEHAALLQTHDNSAACNMDPRMTRAGSAPMTVRSATLLRAASPRPGLPKCRPRISSLVPSIVRTAEPRALALNAPPPQNPPAGRATYDNPAARNPGSRLTRAGSTPMTVRSATLHRSASSTRSPRAPSRFSDSDHDTSPIASASVSQCGDEPFNLNIP